ncbi:hypothetical protein VN97_g9691 [Penicillium thymicola]|uniref:Uncharacterized protein n=1 Tax=Penicillium thymicola TaxID=293382 RepID=A0AAI9X4M3_PENTH|nr:hypothetical protein VN97_g9691 [Penicillium thymicola]
MWCYYIFIDMKCLYTSDVFFLSDRIFPPIPIVKVYICFPLFSLHLPILFSLSSPFSFSFLRLTLLLPFIYNYNNSFAPEQATSYQQALAKIPEAEKVLRTTTYLDLDPNAKGN